MFTDLSLRIARAPGYFPKESERFSYESGKCNSIKIRDQAGKVYHRFSKVTNKSGEERWACQRRKQRGCRVVVVTVGDFIVAQKNEHTCDQISQFLE